jgi:hypothetical protein
VEENNEVTAAWASTGDVSECSVRVDAQVRVVLGRVLAQRRSVEVAFGYVTALAAGVRANCWAIAEEAGHEGPHRTQAPLGLYRWDWGGCAASSPGWPRRDQVTGAAQRVGVLHLDEAGLHVPGLGRFPAEPDAAGHLL